MSTRGWWCGAEPPLLASYLLAAVPGDGATPYRIGECKSCRLDHKVCPCRWLRDDVFHWREDGPTWGQMFGKLLTLFLTLTNRQPHPQSPVDQPRTGNTNSMRCLCASRWPAALPLGRRGSRGGDLDGPLDHPLAGAVMPHASAEGREGLAILWAACGPPVPRARLGM
jgi:hypothetical protein